MTSVKPTSTWHFHTQAESDCEYQPYNECCRFYLSVNIEINKTKRENGYMEYNDQELQRNFAEVIYKTDGKCNWRRQSSSKFDNKDYEVKSVCNQMKCNLNSMAGSS